MIIQSIYDEYVSNGMLKKDAIKSINLGIFSLFYSIKNERPASSWDSGSRHPIELGFIMKNERYRRYFVESCMNDEFFMKEILSQRSITTSDQLEQFIECCDRYKISPSKIFLEKVITQRVQNLVSSGFINNPLPIYSNNEKFREAQTILKYDNTLDYKELSRKLLSQSSNYSFYYSASTVRTCISKWAEEDYNGFYKEIISGAKTEKKDVRSSIYCGAIMSGKADKRLIRRIRSDASEQTSLDCVKVLFEYQNSYSNFSELLMYITDTNYYNVAVYLAENIQTNQLSSLMGTPFQNVKNIIEKRIKAEEELNEV